jgi:hypothetical protein
MLLVGLQAMRKMGISESQGDRPINNFLALLRPPMGPEFWKSRMRSYEIIRIWHAYLYLESSSNIPGRCKRHLY